MTDLELIESGVLKKYVAYKKYQFLSYGEYDNPVYGFAFSESEDELSDISPDDFNRCIQLYNNNRARVLRLRKKIEKMVSIGSCYFLTLTFSDNALRNTVESSRRTYVSRFLDSLNSVYVANIDYGAKNGREHYHAFICLEKPLEVFSHGSNHIDTILNDKWACYGFLNCQAFRNTDSSSVALSKYITKLTYHALKESAGNKSLLYSRKKYSWYKFKGGQNYAKNEH